MNSVVVGKTGSCVLNDAYYVLIHHDLEVVICIMLVLYTRADRRIHHLHHDITEILLKVALNTITSLSTI